MLSSTKLWAHIGYIVLTIAFLKDALAGGLTDMKILAYGGVVCGSAAASKFLSMRYASQRNGNGETKRVTNGDG